MAKVLPVLVLCVSSLVLNSPSIAQTAKAKLNQQLAQAIESGNSARVKLLVDKGANPNASNDAGSSMLTLAVFYGKADIVQLLCDRKANVHAKGFGDNLTPAAQAVVKGNLPVLKLLIAKDATYSEAESGMSMAAGDGQISILQFLLDHGAKVDAPSPLGGATPLMSAAANGKASAVKLLLDKGANVNATNDDKQTPLIYLAASPLVEPKDAVDIAKLLLAKGAHKYAKSAKGDTALVLARKNGKADLATLLR